MFNDHIWLNKLKLTPSSWRRNVLEGPNPKYYLLLLSSIHGRAVISVMSKIPACLEISEGALASIREKKHPNMQIFLDTTLDSALPRWDGDVLFELALIL